ncbi:MAG: hypothetical protein ACOCX4_07480 [Planctomycetota bacterium]
MSSTDPCRRCGRCCYEKVVIDDEVVVTETPCPYLDTVTRLCTVYDRRHAANIRCLTVAEAVDARAFPADCPYVQDLPDYRPPLDPRAGPESAARVEALLRTVAPEDLPR